MLSNANKNVSPYVTIKIFNIIVFSFTSEVDYVVKGGEVERRHDVVSVQNPGGVHQTHELQHLLL